MVRHRRRDVVLAWFVALWAVFGGLFALASYGDVNDDARLLVGTASIFGPVAAAGSAFLLAIGRRRPAGALLALSCVTPTYFAWPFSLAALVVGLGLFARSAHSKARPTSVTPSQA